MRKLVSIAVSAALMLSLAACGKADTSAAASSESKSSASSSSASSNSTSNSTQDYSPDGIKVGETYTTEDGKTYERVWNGTGSDLPTPSPEPKITYDNDFQAQTLVDNEECTIILQSVGYDDDYGYYVCDMSLDEDEMAHFMQDTYYNCPYFQMGDEYKIVRKQM